eukprot:jgi/Tetstr1/454025/TSEL_040944.t1
MPSDALTSGVMLLLAVGAVYMLLNEKRAAPQAVANWRGTDPAWSPGGGFRQDTAVSPPPPEDAALADPLEFTPDIRRHVQRLKDKIAARTGDAGEVMLVEWHCRRFAMLVYRRMGRDPGKTSRADTTRAADDLARARADIVNAVQAMYVSVHRDRLHEELDAVTEGLIRDTDAYIRAVRRVSGSEPLNTYEAGRGFPSPWNEDADPNYDMLV